MTRRPSSPSGRRSGSASARGRSATTTPPAPTRTTSPRCCPTRPASRTWGTSRTTPWATRSRTSSAAIGPARAAPDRLRRVRPAGREPRDQERRAPARLDRESIAAFQREFRSWGVSFDWSRELATHEPSYYRWTQWIFLKLYERGLAYRSRGGGQLVPEGPDGARQRAGHRRPLRALRDAGRGAPARAVVLPHHRLRRPPARRPRDGRVALARRADAAELDRALRGRRGHVRRARDGRRLPRLHDAAGHAVRRDLLRHGARAPRRAAPGRGHRARGRGPRLRQPRADREPRGPRRRRPREDRRAARPHASSTRSTASGSRCGSPTTC